MARKTVVGRGVGRFKVGGETGKKADFEGVSSRKPKTLTKKAMNLIFFLWNLRLRTLWISMSADTCADAREGILIWNVSFFVKFWFENGHFSSSSSEYSNPSISQKIHFSWFWLHIFWFTCRATSIVSQTNRAMLRRPSPHLQGVRIFPRKLSEAT